MVPAERAFDKFVEAVAKDFDGRFDSGDGA
jgi:hypothetical protein